LFNSFFLNATETWVEEEAEGLRSTLLFDMPEHSSSEYEWFLSDLKTALLIQDWIEEIPYDKIVTKYNIWPGDIHNVVEVAEWLLHATREFARMYNFSSVSDVSNVIIRVHNGCKQELLNLISLKGIGRVRARSIFNEGFKTVNDLRNIPVERIANIKNQIGESENIGNKELGEF